MALTKEVIYDKTEIVTEYKIVQVRKRIVIKEDDVKISENYERYSLEIGTLDASNNLVDNPLDKEPDGVTAIPDEIKSMCNLLWTDSVKAAWKTKLIAEDTE
tara:strand:+ start:489 stop:794 length:306 start_codon:yes stop_codon:yes gene_type:complete